MTEYLTYSRSTGFNIVEAETEEEIDLDDTAIPDTVLLDPVEEIDPKVIERIREII